MTPPTGGYVWWYVDALSDDGAHGITIIAFLGSVFSPYYAWARRRGGGDPMRHCCLNVALYGRPRRWAMTERSAGVTVRSRDVLMIGPSGLHWDGNGLTIQIRERGLQRIRGTVRVHPQAMETRRLTLDAAGRHRWQPLAPCARVEVTLDEPSLHWSGPAYFDTNDGDRPLEADFRQWEWCRAPIGDDAAVLYEVERRDGSPLRLAMRYSGKGGVTDLPSAPRAAMSPTRWRVPRGIGLEAPRATRTLEDTPFYARSVFEGGLLGQRATGVHESLSLDRFTTFWVQAMLPFRMPRL